MRLTSQLSPVGKKGRGLTHAHHNIHSKTAVYATMGARSLQFYGFLDQHEVENVYQLTLLS